MKYLIDTNVLSEALKTVPDKSVLKMFEKWEKEIVTAAPVWHELQFGCQRLPRSRKREAIASFLTMIHDIHELNRVNCTTGISPRL